MTQEELKRAISEKRGGIYVFVGEEQYLKRYYLSEFRRAFLDEDFAAFNHLRFEGTDIDFPALREAMLTPPMMSDYKMCEWHLADFNALREKGQKDFASLSELRTECPTTAIVFLVEPDDFELGFLPKKPSKLYTFISKNADIVEFPKSTDRQLIPWIGRHLVHAGISAPPSFADKLIERCGHGMDTLKGEIDKLIAYAKANQKETVDFEDLMTVTSPTSESDAFALSNAILEGNLELAYRALSEMKNRRVEPILILGSVTSVYSDLLLVAKMTAEGLSQAEIGRKMKMHEYKAGLYMRAARRRGTDALVATLDACRKADVRAKTGFGVGYGIIERLVAECATKR